MPKRGDGRKGRGDGGKARGRKDARQADGRKDDQNDQDEAPAPRSFWSGTISFGLVSVPVDLFSINRGGGVSLRMLAPDGTPLRRRYFCPEEDRPIERDEIVRGYRANGKDADEEGYIIVEDDELEALEPEKSRDIDLRRFVDASEIDPGYFERGYILAPAGDSTKAYRLLAAIMERTGRAGIATFVLRKKEYLVAIFAENGILRAETLRFRDELRSPEMVGLPDLPDDRKPDAKRVKSLKKEMEELESDDLPEDEMEDDYAARVLALVERKLKKGEDVVHPDAEGLEEEEEDEEEEEEGKVIDLMQVLRQRLQQSSPGEGHAGAGGGGRGKARAAGRGRASADGARSDKPALRKMTKGELYERAQELDISGRSGMTKDELIEAIQSA